ncbi:MAG: sulfatase [Acidobacteria bacterium]|nr:sulfatase [Acidobacteriota bacterium]
MRNAGLNRRGFLGCAAGAVVARAASRPLNFVFILADDLGWADVGCQGADLHQTPNIDRLASMGVRFTDAYAAAPVCSPTRASILTGKYPARLHMTTWLENSATPEKKRKLVPPVTVGNLPLAETTLAEALKERDYLTALVGKWHLGEAGYYPETQGFDVNIGGTHWGAPQTHFYPYRGSRNFGGEFRYVPHLEFGQPGEYLTDRLTDEAMRVVDHSGSRPFFLYLAHHAVHAPIEAKAADVERFSGLRQAAMHHRNPAYAAMTWSLDQSVGRVLRKLEERGMTENTVVVFTSDNGGLLRTSRGEEVTDNSPLRSGKGALYEGGVRVPLIVYWPGVTPAGAVSHGMVASTDLYATLLEMAGLKESDACKRGVDSRSIVGLLRDPAARSGRDELYFHYPHYYATTTPVSAVRSGTWKLLEFLEDNHVELYDLAKDIGEKDDLAARMPRKAGELRQRLHAWRESVAAQMPRPNPDYAVSR